MFHASWRIPLYDPLCRGEKVGGDWAFYIVISPSRLSLWFCQFLSPFWTFSTFPLKFKFIASSASIESQNPSVSLNTRVLVFGPFHSPSVFFFCLFVCFLLFSQTRFQACLLSRLEVSLWSSEYWLNLISFCLTEVPLMLGSHPHITFTSPRIYKSSSIANFSEKELMKT